jgi:hypothetical protein
MQKRKECKAVSRRLVGYVNATLAETKRREVESHLLRCEPCREHVAQINTVAEMACWAMPEPSSARVILSPNAGECKCESLKQRGASLLARLRVEAIRPVPAYRVAMLLLVLVAAVVALLLVFDFQPTRPIAPPGGMAIEKQISNLQVIKRDPVVNSVPLTRPEMRTPDSLDQHKKL